jgi:hypothetical protein
MGEKRHFTAMSSPNLESPYGSRRKCLVRQVSAALTLLSLRQESLCSVSTTGTLTPPTNVEVDAHCELISTCSSVTDDEEDDEQRSAVNQALGDTLRVVPESELARSDRAMLKCIPMPPHPRLCYYPPVSKLAPIRTVPIPPGRPMLPPPRLIRFECPLLKNGRNKNVDVS